MLELALYTGIASAAKIGPVFKAKKAIGYLFRIPILGWVIAFAYGGLMDWVLLKIFAFQSSLAGLANLTSSLILAMWMKMQHTKKA